MTSFNPSLHRANTGDSNIELPRYRPVAPMSAEPKKAPKPPVTAPYTGPSTAGTSSALVQRTPTAPAAMPPLPYTELDLQTPAQHVKAIDDFIQDAMRSKKSFGTRSTIVRWTAAGGVVGPTLLGIFLGAKVARREIKASDNNTTTKVFAKPTAGQLAYEVGAPVALWVACIAIGVGLQYASRAKLKNKTLQDEWPKLDNLQRECRVLVASHHTQAEEAQNISDSIDQIKGRLGWTPGQDLLNVGKGTVGAAVILVVEIAVAALCVLACAAAGAGGGGGGGDDCCCVSTGGGGGGGCCPGGSDGDLEANRRNRSLPPVGPANWERVLRPQDGLNN